MAWWQKEEKLGRVITQTGCDTFRHIFSKGSIDMQYKKGQ